MVTGNIVDMATGMIARMVRGIIVGMIAGMMKGNSVGMVWGTSAGMLTSSIIIVTDNIVGMKTITRSSIDMIASKIVGWIEDNMLE